MFSVVFRVDSSYHIGSGHLIRSITLARALQSKGAGVSFVCRAHRSAAIKLVAAAGFTTIVLPQCTDAPAIGNASTWSGICEQQDAEQTVNALAAIPDWFFVDSYSCGFEWEASIQDLGVKLGVIDDLARVHTCDLLVDPNWHGNETTFRYKDKLPATATALLGPSYALLGPDFKVLRRAPANRRKPVKRVLVYFGGSDENDLISKAAIAFSTAALAGLSVDIVAGATMARDYRAAAVTADGPAVRLLCHQPSLAPFLATADLAIGAVGGTTWERLCLGVPTLATVLADNQRDIGKALAEEGAIRLLGNCEEITSDEIATDVLSLINAPEERQLMADKGQALVDGHGVDRVVECILALS